MMTSRGLNAKALSTDGGVSRLAPRRPSDGRSFDAKAPAPRRPSDGHSCEGQGSQELRVAETHVYESRRREQLLKPGLAISPGGVRRSARQGSQCGSGTELGLGPEFSPSRDRVGTPATRSRPDSVPNGSVQTQLGPDPTPSRPNSVWPKSVPGPIRSRPNSVPGATLQQEPRD